MLLEVTPPTAEPVTLKEARVHLRQGFDGDSPRAVVLYDDVPDDSWVIPKITAARQSAESFLGYPLTDAIYQMTLQDFTGRPFDPRAARYPWRLDYLPVPMGLQLPPGIGEVESIEYLDPVTHLPVVLATSGYDFDPVTRTVYNDQPWPSISSRSSAVRIKVRGVYGRGSPPVKVPEAIKHAILLMVGEWYANREITIDGRIATIALGVEYLLRPYRTRLGMA